MKLNEFRKAKKLVNKSEILLKNCAISQVLAKNCYKNRLSRISTLQPCILISFNIRIQTIIFIGNQMPLNQRFKIFGISLLLGLFLPLHGLATSPELMVSGNKIVTASGGCPVFLKGADVPSLEWTNTGDPSTAGIIKSVQTTMDWGGNFIRLPLNQDRWLGQACGASASSYQAIVDSIVNTISGRNCWVLLDLHWSDMGTWGGGNVCGTSGTNGEHDMPDDNSTAFWASLAAHYANNPAVLFDLYNEPGGCSTSKLTANAAGWSLWRWGGSAWGDGNYHSPGMQGLVTTVRATGARNIIFAGGINWAFDLSGLPAYGQWLTDTAGTDGIAYATHIYPFKQANYGCALSCWSAAVPSSVYSTHAVVVTEFGENSGQPDTTGAWPLSVCSWAEQYCQGWVAWCMHDSATPNLISDWNYTPTSWYGAVIKPRMASVSGGGCNGTPTSSPSRTPSPSSTRTATASSTMSPSLTPSATAEPSGTSSATRTPSFSSTPTSTATSSATATASSTQASSATSSATRTPSASSTPTSTATPTATASSSITAGPSATSSVTRTASPTPAGTATFSSSASFTPSGTSTATGTATSSATPTPSTAASSTMSPSLTPSATAEPSSTSSCTAGPSATSSATATLSRTATATATPSPEPSASSTSSATVEPAGTPSFSPTSQPGQGLRIIRSLPLPNPNPRQLAVELSGPADALQVKFWTVSLKLVGGMSARQLKAGWNSIAIPSGLLTAKGAYFYTITATRNGASASLSKPGKLMVE